MIHNRNCYAATWMCVYGILPIVASSVLILVHPRMLSELHSCHTEQAQQQQISRSTT